MSATPIACLDPLEARFDTLFNAHVAPDCPATAATTLRHATALAGVLLANQRDKRPLHGDLHHDNIRNSPRGYLAFDAKGVWGDRRFELANAFWNPLDMQDSLLTPTILHRRATLLSAGFGAEAKDLLHWAAAYTALALSWDGKGTFGAAAAQRTPYIDTLFSLIATA